ncbi:cAMP-dependent protein kinase catalytic subunit PkaC1 [Talaromyces stipitatus ATCC 10500]|uniref:cAMP-dependent protein kinase n=1 Tax=Talaromyces stipitatus (strain ATCC 10500 / CBS 375.48 / QM 6759 / NRRL 1006) TaxID=441959 RepID=B8MLH4_TALSN|nr:cAMP-dependent protein kinase catalytic subunit PkaC1 [Talaromyces stipitatus ATCC 10500]EED15507.1 cAMP-dependent protein kinase catalytic subunit PkaC1 [Talaromyces stipitatus ATCC 10500]
MPTFGSLLKKKKTLSTGGSKEVPNSSSTGAEPSTTSATSDKPAEQSHRSSVKESNDSSSKKNSAVSTSAETSNQKGNSQDNQMTLTSSTNQQPAQGANTSSSHHHHHLPNIGSIKSIINPTHHQQHENESHAQQQGHTDNSNNNVQASQGQLASLQARQTKGKYSLEDFSLQRTLGTGSFGRVHLVQSRHNHRFYAIKVLKKAQVVKMKQVEHTNDERRMLQRVKHPFLITLWGTFQDSKNLYMVMDFVEGGELFSLLRKSQRFPNPVAKFYAAEVTLALEYLHAQHIIYRDLKPENLLLDRHGHLKITDFGFAKEVPDITWTLCGTPDYLAPEVVSSKGYNKSVDWWSLGILIFEMLCGFTPFWDSGSPVKIYENILRGKIKYPPYMHPDAVDLLSQLITPDLTKRLGNLHGGPEDVKNHPWFAEVTWDRLLRKDIDAPYVPPVRAGQGDASQFDKYPEENEAYGSNGDDPYHSLFTEF